MGPPSRRWCRMFSPTASPRLFTPSFARIPASVIVSRRSPSSSSAVHSEAALRRIDVPVPVLGQPRALARVQARRSASTHRRARSRCGRSARRPARVRRPPRPRCPRAPARAGAASAPRVSARPPRGAARRRVRARATSRRARGTSAAPPRSARPAPSPPRGRERCGSSSLVPELAESGVVHGARTIAIVRGWPTIPTTPEPPFPAADPTTFASSASPSSASPTSQRLPHTVKILLESLLRHAAASTCSEERRRGARPLARARPPPARRCRSQPARVVLQDFTGVPAVVDLAAMRAAMARAGGDAARVDPLVPCDLVIDHSVQVDAFGVGSRLRAQHRPRVRAQRRALPAAALGAGRVRRLPRRAARHGDRAPGQPRAPRARRRSCARAAGLRSPTRSSAPTRTRR